jgi:hypothetical protein
MAMKQISGEENPLSQKPNCGIRLKVKTSESPKMRLCLIARGGLQAGEEIFSKELLLAMPGAQRLDFTCNNCFQ